MAGVKISALPAVASALTTDYFPVVQGGITSRETIAQVQTLFGYTAGILGVSSGGTGLSSAGSIPAPSTYAAWTSNRILRANMFLYGLTTTVTAAGTTTLTSGSNNYQLFTGSTTQTVVLPVVSTFPNTGANFMIVNNSSGVVTVNSSGGNLIQAMASNTTLNVTSILTTGTTAASWNAIYSASSLIPLPVSLANGGTAKALTASAGGIVWSDADSFEILAGTATAGKMLQSGASVTPSWSTPTWPSASGTSGKILISDGTNNVYSTPTWPTTAGTSGNFVISDGTNKINSTSLWPNTVGTAGQIIRSNGTSNAYTTSTFSDTYAVSTILYASASNVVGGLATANNGVLVTNGSGVPSISSTLPSALAMQTPSSLVLTNATGLPVAGGGTGAASFTAYSLIAAGTTSTGAFQNVSGVGTSGQYLISNGAAALPTWQTITPIKTINYVVITGSGTYTPTANTQFIMAEVVGGGGGAGSITGGTAGNAAISGGGGGGGYARKLYTAAGLGATATVTIGAGGAGGTGGGGGGSTGGTTTFSPAGAGGVITGAGGAGGFGMTQNTTFQMSEGGDGGVGSAGNFNATGSRGNASISFAAAIGVYGGGGGASYMSTASYNFGSTASGSSGGTTFGYGQGASGRYSVGTGGSTGNGANGNAGACIITEFIS